MGGKKKKDSTGQTLIEQTCILKEVNCCRVFKAASPSSLTSLHPFKFRLFKGLSFARAAKPVSLMLVLLCSEMLIR